MKLKREANVQSVDFYGLILKTGDDQAVTKNDEVQKGSNEGSMEMKGKGNRK